jgi:hypothetical protein
MDDEKMLEIAEKIKSGTATEQEEIDFLKEYTRLLKEMKKLLES